jgi:apolipoprotein N-acyltransferase
MANMLIPVQERHLTPLEVEALDRRRRRGQLMLVLCGMCVLVGTLVLCWSGQDATYSPGWARPMVYWNIILFVLAAIFFVAGIALRRGTNEYMSY